MKQKLIILLVAIICVCSVCLFVSCQSNEQEEDDNTAYQIKTTYQIWLESGHTGSEADFLEWLRGSDGSNGNNGSNGKSAFELYKDKFGYQGTEEQWLSDLVDGKLSQNSNTSNVIKVRFVADDVIEFKYPTEKIVAPDIPEKAGYYGVSWGNPYFKDGALYLEPIYKPCQYQLNLVDEYTNYEGTYFAVYQQESKYVPIPSREGYRFWGWSNETGSISLQSGEIWHFIIDEPMTLTAVWYPVADNDKFKFELNSDGESYSVKLWYLQGVGSVDVPSSYNGKPVTRIDWGLNLCDAEIIRIPETITEIADHAFAGFKSLRFISLPEGITSIGVSMFSGCSSMYYFTIPESITSIGKNAFNGCENLRKINIPASVTYIDDEAFVYCSNVESITVSDDNEVYKSVGNCLIDIENETIVSGCKNSVIPRNSSVKYIGIGAFAGCSNLTSIVIPDNIVSIGHALQSYQGTLGAFIDCTSIKSIEIPASVTSIEKYSFKGCSSLENLIIADGVRVINDEAFADCTSLKSVVIPNSVLYLSRTFSGCIRLENVVLGEMHSISGAFENCWSLTSITLPSDPFFAINAKSFNNCFNLTEINYSGTMEEWQNLRFGELWNGNVPATKVICSDGEVDLSSQSE